MTETFYNLFYLGVLALICGCAVYLLKQRGEEDLVEGPILQRIRMPHPETRLPRQVLKKAEGLSGSYRLGDLEKIFTELAAIQAWDLIVEIRFPDIRDFAQMDFQRNEVDLYSHQAGVIPDYFERFRRSAEGAGLEILPISGAEEDFHVRILGSWPQIAAMAVRLIKEIYGVDETMEMNLRVFR